MKKYIYLSIIVVSMSLTFSHRAFADASEESQRDFEAEVESIDMSDINGETNTAQGEALQEEQNLQAQKRDLKDLRNEKTHLEKTAKVKIASAEMRRAKALKEQAKYSLEIRRLERQIDGIKATVARHESRAQEADDLAASEEADLDDLRQERTDLRSGHHVAKRVPATKKAPTHADQINADNDMDVEAW